MGRRIDWGRTGIGGKDSLSMTRGSATLVAVGVLLVGSACVGAENADLPDAASAAAGETVSASTSTTSQPSTSPASSSATTSPAAGVTSSVSVDDLLTSIEDPQAWVDQVYTVLNTVYNGADLELLDYILFYGHDGPTGDFVAEEVTKVRATSPDPVGGDGRVQLSGLFVDLETIVINDGSVIRVFETFSAPSFFDNDVVPGGETQREVLFYVTPPVEVTFDGVGTVEAYMISGIAPACTYAYDGCSSLDG